MTDEELREIEADVEAKMAVSADLVRPSCPECGMPVEDYGDYWFCEREGHRPVSVRKANCGDTIARQLPDT
jgi:hypothetical protein